MTSCLARPPERQAEIIRLIAEGKVEFVARAGDFIPLVASLIERHSRSGRSLGIRARRALGRNAGRHGGIFRHENR
jgi:hypothetical protein